MALRQYTVLIHRTEAISFRLTAESPEDAEARYLGDGDETGSETVATEVQFIGPED
ncbi:hypothetical protein [Streptomyces sp. NPDC058751]|uniref:hypothetical protein n=1 Tax=Streptomyces sp. NPDC058751 TaxID=3346623 RepID=UPI00367D770D